MRLLRQVILIVLILTGSFLFTETALAWTYTPPGTTSINNQDYSAYWTLNITHSNFTSGGQDGTSKDCSDGYGSGKYWNLYGSITYGSLTDFSQSYINDPSRFVILTSSTAVLFDPINSVNLRVNPTYAGQKYFSLAGVLCSSPGCIGEDWNYRRTHPGCVIYKAVKTSPNYYFSFTTGGDLYPPPPAATPTTTLLVLSLMASFWDLLTGPGIYVLAILLVVQLVVWGFYRLKDHYDLDRK